MNWIYESVNHRGSGPGEIIITMTWLLRSWCRQQNIQMFTPGDTGISMRIRSGMCMSHLTPLWWHSENVTWLSNMLLVSFELELSHAAWGWMTQFQGSVWVSLVLSLFAIIVPAYYYKLVDATSFHRYIKWSILVPNKTVCHGCK